MQTHPRPLPEIRRQLDAQTREWERLRDELASLQDIQILMPQARFEELEAAFEVHTSEPVALAFGIRV